MRYVIVKKKDGYYRCNVCGEDVNYIKTGPGTFRKDSKRHVLWGSEHIGGMEYRDEDMCVGCEKRGQRPCRTDCARWIE